MCVSSTTSTCQIVTEKGISIATSVTFTCLLAEVVPRFSSDEESRFFWVVQAIKKNELYFHFVCNFFLSDCLTY